MESFGAEIFFIIIFLLMVTLAFYAGYRMTQRATVADTAAYAAVLPTNRRVSKSLKNMLWILLTKMMKKVMYKSH